MSSQAERPRELVAAFARTAAFGDPVLAARACAVLAPDERNACTRLRDPAARRDYLAAHALARTRIAAVCGCPPDRLCFRASPHGRPEIVAPSDARRFCFSLSHADGIALCAVSARYDVGVDVESRHNIGPDPLGLADTVCSPGERRALLSLSSAERPERMLRIWTLKEAIAKAMGLGFHLPFERIAVHWKRGRSPAVEIDVASGPAPSAWQLASTRLTRDHVAAVAVRGPRARGVTVRFEQSHVPGWPRTAARR